MRPIQWHLKNNWRVLESLEKAIPIPTSLHPHLEWWLEEDNMLHGQPLHPLKHALQIFTDASKEGWGTHLNEHTAKGVSTRKQATHKLPRVEGSPSSSKGFSATRSKPNSPCSYRQHHSSFLNKQGRRHEVRPTLCNTVENFDMVYGKPSYSQSPAYSRPVECGSGQTVQTRPDYSNRMVSPHRGFSDHMHQVAPTSNRPLCHEVQQQTPSACLTGA